MSTQLLIRRVVLFTCALAVVLTAGVAGQFSASQASAAGGPGPFTSLDAAVKAGFISQQTVDRAAKQGAAPVIVQLQLATPFLPEGKLPAKAVADQRLAIKSAQDYVVQKLGGFKSDKVKRFQTLPHLALQADTTALTALVAIPGIARIAPDQQNAPTLSRSVPLIGADRVRRAENGSAGAGQTVAIVDSGVDSTHPFLNPRVISDACYSSSSSWLSTDADDSSTCPGGADSNTNPGSAEPCAIADCAHGTHVAGIAAGLGTQFNAVAPEANILAIQVFHTHDDAGECAQFSAPNPCILADDSQVIQALERVYSLRSTYSLASVNLSLGSLTTFTSQADCDANNSSYKNIIDNLRSAGIATVIAAGNHAQPAVAGGNQFVAGVASPACISSAVSVGATDATVPGAETVADFSEAASFLNLLAPGVAITSSVPLAFSCSGSAAGFCPFFGTSMASPHVTGSFAVLKALSPTASVDTPLNALTSTGTAVTDSRSWTNLVFPRVQLDAAAEAIIGTPLPPSQLHVQPGTLAGTSVGLAWTNNARNAATVRAEIVDPITGTLALAGSVSAALTSQPVSLLIPNSPYKFQVRACSQNAACSAPSNRLTVSTLDTLPSAPTNLRPGTITSSSIENGLGLQQSEPHHLFPIRQRSSHRPNDTAAGIQQPSVYVHRAQPQYLARLSDQGVQCRRLLARLRGSVRHHADNRAPPSRAQ